MRIEVYGPGCQRCRKTEAVVKKVLAELGLEAEVVKITEIEAILDKGILKTPAVFLDGEKMSEGRIPSEEEVRRWIGK